MSGQHSAISIQQELHRNGRKVRKGGTESRISFFASFAAFAVNRFG
jgi:hypothetical protein